jgi:hypothetical protein
VQRSGSYPLAGPLLLRGLLGGAIAGLVAILLARLFHLKIPPAQPIFWSSLLSGALAALLYLALLRSSRQAQAWLWGLSLLAAAGISLLVATQPIIRVKPPLSLFGGLVAPFLQLLELLHLIAPGRIRFPSQALFGDTVLHFAVAIVVAFVLTWRTQRA